MLTGEALPQPTIHPPPAHLSRVTAHGDPKGSSQPEIGQFQLPILREMGGTVSGPAPWLAPWPSFQPGFLIVQPLAPNSLISHLLPKRYPVYEQILRLQVPVQHVSAVTKPQAF